MPRHQIKMLYGICISGVCSVLFPCFWLSVALQSILWKASFRKSPIM